MKTRLLGAAVLIVLAVLFVPMFFSSSPPTSGGDQTVSLAIPPAPDRDLQTKTMSLTPDANSPAGAGTRSAAPTPAAVSTATAAPSNQLATVNIGSNRPRDVETDPNAGKVEPTTVTRPNNSTTQALIPVQTPGSTTATRGGKAAVPAQPSPELPAATAARGNYTINLSAYSNAGAQKLMQRVRGMGYPVSGRPINRAGQSLTLVSAGPFESRAAAEAARLKIGQAVSGVKPTLESGATTPGGDVAPPTAVRATPAATVAAAAPASGHRAGGYAVQVAAVGSQADATALRDKLRANGFDGFTDSVNVNGKQLWRVRAGPQTQRADAERLRDQIKAKLGMAGNVVGVP